MSLYDQLETAGLSWVNDYLSWGDMSEDEAWGYLNPVTSAPVVTSAAPVTAAPVVQTPVTAAPVYGAQGGYWYDDGGDSYWYDTATGQSDYNGPQAVAATSATVAQTPVTAAPVTTASVTTTQATPAATYEYDNYGDYVGSGGGYDESGNPSPEQAALDAQWQQDYINHTGQWAPTGQAAIDTGMSWAAPVTADAGLASLQALGNPLGTTGNSYLAAAGAALPATVTTTPDATVATTPDAATGALPAGYGGRPVLTGNAGSGYTTGQDIPLGMMLNPAYGSPALDTREHGYLVGPAHSLDAPQFIEDPSYIPPIEEVPMPEVLAKNGHEVVPIYNTKSTGDRNAPQNYGKPIGYYYDNGNSTYVRTDAEGNITGEQARTDAWTSFREGFLKPAATIIAAVYGEPYLSEALGAGAAAAPTNAALIDSAVGTAGYGVSSATAPSLLSTIGNLPTTIGTAITPAGTAPWAVNAAGSGALSAGTSLAQGNDLETALKTGATSAVTGAAMTGLNTVAKDVLSPVLQGTGIAPEDAVALGEAALTGNKAGLVTAGLNIGFGGLSTLTGASLPDGITPKDVAGVVNIINGVNTNSLSQVLSGASTLMNNPNVTVASKAVNLYNTALTGDWNKISAASSSLDGAVKALPASTTTSALPTTTADTTGTDTTGYDAVNALQTAGLTEDTSGNGGPDVDLSRTVVPTDYVAYKPGTIGYSDIRDKWMEAANGSPAGFEAFAKDLKNSGFTANQIALAMGISPESAQAALNYKAPIAPRTEVTTAFDSSGIKALNDKYVADTNALNKLYSTDPAGFLAYMGTMGIDPTNFSDMDSYMGWPTGTSETLIPPVIAAQTAAADNITNPDLAATDWEKLYAEGADKSTSQEGYTAQDFGVTLSGDISTASGFVPYTDPDTGSPTGDLIYTSDDGSTITMRQDGSVETTPSPTIDPMYTLDPVAVTAAGTGVEGGDQYLGVDTTDQNVLDPVTVTGTKDTVLDPVTVTGTKDTVLDPVTVTGTKDTVLDPVTVTGTAEPPLVPLEPVEIPPSEPIPEVVVPPVVKPPAVVPPGVRITPSPRTTTPTTTTGGGGLPVTDPAALAGLLLKLGKMGKDVSPYELKQLTPHEQKMLDYIKDDPLSNVDVMKALAASEAASRYVPPTQQAQAYTDPALDPYAQYYAEGGEVKSETSYSNEQMADALKRLGNIDSGLQQPKPQVFSLRQVGSPSQAKALQQMNVIPQLAALLQSRGMKFAEGGSSDHHHPEYDGTPVFRSGGLDGLGGKYVEGKGDGQSDDIPAMLADGEYVFDAQTVSDFGNGSNKAGAKILDAMRNAIREHKRSAPVNSIPPKSKTPQQYLKDAGKYLKGIK